jgi:N-acetylmuramoyl-L-alanine amidase
MHFKILVIVSFLGTLFFSYETFSKSRLRVVIDPGHGGSDFGAYFFGFKESEINLKVSMELYRMLSSDNSFDPLLTRTRDISLSLEERSEIANQSKGSVFISLHSNSFPNSKAHGAEFYFQNQLPPNEEALYLANKENNQVISRINESWPLRPVEGHLQIKSEVSNILQDLQLNHRIFLSSQLAEALSLNWKGQKRSQFQTIKQAPFHVISNVNMPSSLIEMGYLSHDREAKLLADKSYQNKIANSLYRALIKYKEIVDKSPSVDLD